MRDRTMTVTPSEDSATQATEVYVVRAAGYYLVYSPLRRYSALVNSAAVAALRRSLLGIEECATGSQLPEVLTALRDTLAIPPDRLSGPIQPDFLGIVPTRACNGNCGYCDFGARDVADRTIGFEVAKAAVDWMCTLMCQRGRADLQIHFFGGEPLIAPEVVEVVVHRARLKAAKTGLRPRFQTTTNGVCTERLAHFLGDYFTAVVLSLDGFERIHDSHRPLKGGGGSFRQATRTASIIRDSSAQLCLRCCVSALNVAELPSIAQWFARTFQPSVVNFEPLGSHKNASAAGILPADPYEFARNFEAAAGILEGYGVEPSYGALCEKLRYASCPVGRDTVILFPDGQLNACYQLEEKWKKRGLNFRIGEVVESEVLIDQESVDALRQLVAAGNPRCRHCFCRWTCAGSCRLEISYPGSLSTYARFCLQTRAITLSRLLADLGRADLAAEILQKTDWLETMNDAASDLIEDWHE
jgi:uncharacterized protein